IALESNYYYESSKSKIFNLFYPSKSNRNHFTKVRILNHLYYLIKNSSKRKEYTRVEEIAIQFAKAGYTTDVIREEIQDLFDSRLISTSEYAEDIEEEPKIINTSLIAITSVGVFYLRSLLGRFHYIDLVLQDTPIYDPTSFEELSRVFPESDENGNRRLDGRKSSALAFLKYLSAEEKKDRVFIENFDDKIIMFDVCASIKETLARDIDRISGAIVRDSSRP
ncbi:MAG TPA: hypothetical protein VHS96_04435, partial [Bacteroidia bacterium]|nr:hypothetical protein [Bacteroidia bacterium]